MARFIESTKEINKAARKQRKPKQQKPKQQKPKQNASANKPVSNKATVTKTGGNKNKAGGSQYSVKQDRQITSRQTQAPKNISVNRNTRENTNRATQRYSTNTRNGSQYSVANSANRRATRNYRQQQNNRFESRKNELKDSNILKSTKTATNNDIRRMGGAQYKVDNSSRREFGKRIGNLTEGSVKQVVGGHLTAISHQNDRTGYDLEMERITDLYKKGKIDKPAYEAEMKSLREREKQGKKKSEVYESKARAIQNAGDKQVREGMKGLSGISKVGAEAYNSLIGMGMDMTLGPASLVGMASRTYGNSLNSLNKLVKKGIISAEEAERYAAMQSVKEVGTELLFKGAGAAAGYAGAGKATEKLSLMAKRGIDKATQRINNNVLKNVVSTGLKLGQGAAEEATEEAIAGVLDAPITNIAYANRLDKEYRGNLEESGTSINSQRDQMMKYGYTRDEATAIFVDEIGSDDYLNDLAQQYIDDGMSEKRALKQARNMQAYMIASLNGDEKTIQSLEDKMAEGIKAKFSLSDTLEAMAAAGLMTAVTGGLGSVNTMIKGEAYKNLYAQANGTENAAEAITKIGKGLSDKEMAARASAMYEHASQGKELSYEQYVELGQAIEKQAIENSSKAQSAIKVARNQAESEGFYVSATPQKVGGRYAFGHNAVETQFGSVIVPEGPTQQRAEEVRKTAYAVTNQIEAELGTALDDKDALVEEITAAECGFASGDIVEYLTDAFPENRAVYEAITGVKLPADNAKMRDAVFTRAIEKNVEMAKAETIERIDLDTGNLDVQYANDFGGEGQQLFHALTNNISTRDKETSIRYRTAFREIYDAGRTGASLDAAMEYAKDVHNLDKADVIEIFNAGIKDKNNKDIPTVTYNVSDPSKIKNSEREVFLAFSRAFGVNIVITDDFTVSDGQKVGGQESVEESSTQVNGMFYNNSIYINLNDDIRKPIGYTIMHELTHGIKQMFPEDYDTFAELFKERWIAKNGEESFSKAIQGKIKTYTDNNVSLSEADALEEIICDQMAEVLYDEQFMQNIAENHPSLAQSLLYAIQDVIRKIRQLFANYGGFRSEFNEATLSQLDMLKDAEALLVKAIQAAQDGRTQEILNEGEVNAEFPIQGTTTQQAEYIAENMNVGIKFSLPTFHNEMPKFEKWTKTKGFTGIGEVISGKELLIRTMVKNGTKEDVAKRIVGFLTAVANGITSDVMHATYAYINWENLENSEVSVRIDREGNITSIVGSAMVANGEYPVNFDFTTICNKREGMMEIIKKLALTQTESGTSYLDEIKLTRENIWKMNLALKEHNVDTACLGCFVEARRYNTDSFLSKIDEKWNSAVRAKRRELGLPEEEYFDFSTNAKPSNEDVSQAIELWEGYDSNKTRGAKSSPAARINTLLKNATADSPYLKLIHPSDMLTPAGIEGLSHISVEGHSLVKTMKSIYGTAAPKEILAFTPYNSEIALLPEKVGDKDIIEYLKEIGGVRVQSFSDFKIENVFDYMQMVADMAARKFPAHAYTKVIEFAEIFGLTGIKINLSVMFDVHSSNEWTEMLGCDSKRAKEIAKKYAGLTFVEKIPEDDKKRLKDEKQTRPYKFVTDFEGTGKDGYLTYLVGDKDRAEKAYQAAKDAIMSGQKYRDGLLTDDEVEMMARSAMPFDQSINYNEAAEKQDQEGYKEHIGIIAVGYSDEHIRMLLDDNNVRYIIPYHKSGLPTEISKVSNLGNARSYEDLQNTIRVKDGKIYDGEGKAKNLKKHYESFAKEHKGSTPAIDYITSMINSGDYTITTKEKKLDENGEVKETKADVKLHGTGTFDVYKSLAKHSEEGFFGVQAVAEEYCDHCLRDGCLPIFYQFVDSPSYFKFLFDYAVTDADGNIHMQGAVKNAYPGINADEVAQNREIEESDLKELYASVRKGMAMQNEKNRNFAENKDSIIQGLTTKGTAHSIVEGTNLAPIINGTPDYLHPKYAPEISLETERSDDTSYSQPGAKFSISVEEANRFEEEYRSLELWKLDEEESFDAQMEFYSKWQKGVADKDTFFYNTMCDWKSRKSRPKGKPDYVSRTRDGRVSSEYWYTDDGVIRGSNHWGKGVASCDWIVDGNRAQKYGLSKGEKIYAKASWGDFVFKTRSVVINGDNYLVNFDNTAGKGNVRTDDDYEYTYNPYDRKWYNAYKPAPLSEVIPSKESVIQYSINNPWDTSWFDGMLDDEEVKTRGDKNKSLAEISAEFTNIVRDNAKLTGGKILDKKSVKKQIGELVKMTTKDTTYTAKEKREIADFLMDTAEQIWSITGEKRPMKLKQEEIDRIISLLYDASDYVISNAKYINDTMLDEIIEFKKFFRGREVGVSAGARDELADDWDTIRKRNIGRVRFVSAEKHGVTNIADALIQTFPEAPEISLLYGREVEEALEIGDEATLVRILDDVLSNLSVVDDAIKSEYAEDFRVALSQDFARIVLNEGEAWESKMDRFKDRYEQRIKDLRARQKEAVRDMRSKYEKLLAEQNATFKKKLAETKAKGEARLQEEKAKNKAKEQKRKDSEQRKKIRNRIAEDYNWLAQRLVKPKKDDFKHIPSDFVESVANLLEIFDFQTERSLQIEEKRGYASEPTKAMRELKDKISKYSSPDGSNTFIKNDALDALIDECINFLDDRPLRELEDNELQKVSEMLRAVRHMVQTQNALFVENRKVGVAEAGESIISESAKKIEKYGRRYDRTGISGKLSHLLNETMMTPGNFFDSLGGTMKTLYKNLRNAQDDYIRKVKFLRDFYKELLGGYYKKAKPGSAVEDWQTQTNEFTLGDGTRLNMTVAQVMSLHCLSKRKQALGHIRGSGIVLSDVTLDKGVAKVIGSKIQNTASGCTMTYNDVMNVISSLTDEQKRIADAIQNLMNTTLKEWGNETSLRLFDMEFFTEENYFPISVEQSELATEIGKGTEIKGNRITSFGMTKPLTEHANNKIIIGDIFSIAADHCNKMALYSAYAPSLIDFNRVYNYEQRNEDGTTGYSVKGMLKDAYSNKALKFIDNILDDINGQAQPRTDGLTAMINTSLANYKKAAIGLNPRVFVQQPTAIMRSLYMINPKYFTPDCFIGLKKTREEMHEHCPIAAWKAWGNYQNDYTKNFEDVMLNKDWSKFDAVTMGAYGWADDMTWAVIWNAVKKEVKQKNPDVEVGSEEYWNLCTERASEIYDETQVVDSVFHRSDAMRSPNGFAKLFTSFMAEPTRTYNMVRSSAVKAFRSHKDGDNKAAASELNKMLVVVTLNAAAVSAAAAVIDAFRGKGDDDDDETWLETFYRNFGENFKDNVNMLHNIVFVKDVVSLFENAMDGKYFSPSNMVLEGWYKLAKGTAEYKKVLSGDKTFVQWISGDFGAGIGYVTGIPTATFIKDAKALWNRLSLPTFASDGVEEETPSLWDYENNPLEITDGTWADNVLNFFGLNLTAEERAERDFKRTLKEVENKTKKLSGDEKKEEVNRIVMEGYTSLVEDGDFAKLKQMRRIIKAAGGDVEAFDEKVTKRTASEYKKTIGVEGSEQKQSEMRQYLLENGWTEAKISGEIVYKSNTAKEFKRACRELDIEKGTDILTTLILAGITEADAYKLWENINRGNFDTYSTGKYIAPTSGQITSGFGYRSSPTAGASSYHQGIDIAASRGSVVSAADGGRVVYAGYNGGYGNQIVIQHDDGTQTYYSHLDYISVRKGQSVSQKQYIGNVGSTGISTGPHLDFRVNVGGQFVDPLKYFSV